MSGKNRDYMKKKREQYRNQRRIKKDGHGMGVPGFKTWLAQERMRE